MLKKFLLLVTVMAVSSQVYAQSQSATQNWECALDLHQGDTGTLSLMRSGDSLQGEIRLERNDSVFESMVNGSWRDDTIHLTRLSGTESSEAMSGVVVALGTQKINIGGRFATDYQGVWSADCDLVSESSVAQDVREQSADVQPSTSSRIRPNSPNSQDRITFSALASHPEGIEKVSFFLGKNEIHSCDNSRCEFSYGPLAEGIYSWRVDAVSKSGITNTEDINRLVVKDVAEVNNCTISGHATGQSAALADIYLVKLYGPNNANALKATSGFNGGGYQFSNLPAGDYRLLIDTLADQEILASPANTTVSCRSQSVLTQDIEFR